MAVAQVVAFSLKSSGSYWNADREKQRHRNKHREVLYNESAIFLRNAILPLNYGRLI